MGEASIWQDAPKGGEAPRHMHTKNERRRVLPPTAALGTPPPGREAQPRSGVGTSSRGLLGPKTEHPGVRR